MCQIVCYLFMGVHGGFCNATVVKCNVDVQCLAADLDEDKGSQNVALIW